MCLSEGLNHSRQLCHLKEELVNPNECLIGRLPWGSSLRRESFQIPSADFGWYLLLHPKGADGRGDPLAPQAGKIHLHCDALRSDQPATADFCHSWASGKENLARECKFK